MRGESFYKDRLAGIVDELLQKEIAVESERAIVVPVPGFEAPLMIRKSDQSYLYGTTDLAALKFRTQELHARPGHLHARFATIAALQPGLLDRGQRPDGPRELTSSMPPFGTMLGEDGKPFKTRSGDTIKLKDLLDEAEERAYGGELEKQRICRRNKRKQSPMRLALGRVKYSDLSKDRVSDYVFSWDKMLALDGNTAPYLQYAYARIQSIFRKAGRKPAADATITFTSPYELALAKLALGWEKW